MSNAKGMKRKVWKDRVQKVYSSLEELRAYDSTYAISKRCGYADAESLWNDNPVIQGSTDPADFGLARQPKKRSRK